ncbi:Uncharacterised protein [Mycobacteroides abscessus]|nr:Uncharacterised protein [Mycobacteroides abscessus]
MFAVRSTVRANFPSAYAFSFVRPPPPNTATASQPCAAWTRSIPAATTSRASSHGAGRSSPPGPRRSGLVNRSGARRTVALVQPFWHSPPRLVGKSRGATATGSGPRAGVSVMPHWSAQ